MQTIKFRGITTNLYYQYPRLKIFDDAVVRKMFDKEHCGIDIEEVMKAEEEFIQLKEQGKSVAARPKTHKKKKVIRPKEKSIIMNEICKNYKSDRLVTRLRSTLNTDVSRRDKGKKRVDKTSSVPVSIVEIDPTRKSSIIFRR